MFLVTTANQKFWKTDEKILFLGEWCRMYDQKHVWSNLDHETLPSPWDEWEKLDQRYTYLESTYERYFANLASNLNDSHCENHSFRYWRIIIGPWLNRFIQVIYDRYLSIKLAIDSGKVTHTWIPTLNSERWGPMDTDTFIQQAFTNNNFNFYLYGRIITQLGQISFEYKEVEPFFYLPDPAETKPLTFLAKTEKNIRNLLEEFSKRIPYQFNQIVFFTSGLSFWNLLKLQFSLGQITYLVSPHNFLCKTPINDVLREGIKFPEGTNEFESILNELIVEQLPTSFLEDYSVMRNKSLDAFPKRPKVIFTSNDYAFND